MAPGLIVKWNLGPVQPPREEIIILSIALWTSKVIEISRQLVGKHCKDTANCIKLTYRQFWCTPFGSSGFQWCSRRRTGTSTGPDRRSSPPAVWWSRLSPAWPAALQSKHRESRHAGASTGSPLLRRVVGREKKKRKKKPKHKYCFKGSILEFAHTFWAHLELNWPSNLEEPGRGNKRRLVII